MKWKFILLVMMFILLSACTPEVDTTEVGSDIVEVATPTEPHPAQVETAPPTNTPPSPTEAATATESEPFSIDTARPTEPQPTQVMPFTAESIGPGQQLAYTFTSNSGEEIIYWLYLPEAYDETRSWPLIISLHGFLGFESSLDRVRGQSPPAWVDSEVDFPFIVISPQGPSGSWAQYHEPLDELVEYLGESLLIDPEAQFLTGPSTGAAGTWQWALAYPKRFIGVAPVAGGFSLNPNDPVPENICDLKDLPVWIAFSESDPNIELSRAAVAALEDCGSTVTRLITYSDLEHMDSIRKTYAGPELYDWMLALLD